MERLGTHLIVEQGEAHIQFVENPDPSKEGYNVKVHHYIRVRRFVGDCVSNAGVGGGSPS